MRLLICIFGFCLMFIVGAHALPQWGLDQIAEDLAPWRERGVSRSQIERVISELALEHWQLVHVKVEGGEIKYKHITGQPIFNDRRLRRFSEGLSRLLDGAQLPEGLEFLVSLADTIEVSHILRDLPVPIFTFSKDPGTKSGICIPDFEAVEGNAGFRDAALRGIQRYSWEQKINRAFWRGSSSGYITTSSSSCSINRNFVMSVETCLDFPRIKLARFASKFPGLMNVKISNFCQYGKSDATLQKLQLLCPHGQRRSIEDHLQYKYLIDVDGNACSYSRMYWILLSNSVLFKQVGGEIQWYYKALVPWKHFIPFSMDMKDLPRNILWARNNDVEVKKIAETATELVHQVFSQEALRDYMLTLLEQYYEQLSD